MNAATARSIATPGAPPRPHQTSSLELLRESSRALLNTAAALRHSAAVPPPLSATQV